MRGFVEQTVNQKLAEFLEENPTDARADRPRRPIAAARARQAARKARELTRRKTRARAARRCPASSPTARSAIPSSAELYLVEGNSRRRLGQVEARDRTSRRSCRCAARSSTSEKNRINKVLSNTEIQAMITAIGTGIGEEFDIEKLRYHRVIVMTDADVDGAHIRTLILTFLYRHMHGAGRGAATSTSPCRRSTASRSATSERYFEKESQLEELLVRERVEDIEITDRDGEPSSSSPRRATSGFSARAERVRGLGVAAARRLRHRGRRLRRSRHRLVETEATSPTERRDGARRRSTTNGYELEVVERDGRRPSGCKVIERETSAARTSSCPAELLASPVYAQPAPRLREAGRGRRARRRSQLALGKKTRDRAHVRGAARARSSSWPRRACRSAASRASAR